MADASFSTAYYVTRVGLNYKLSIHLLLGNFHFQAGTGQFPGLQGGQFAGQFAYPQYQNPFSYQTNPYQQPYQFPFQSQFTQFPYQQNPYQQLPYQQLPYQFPYQQNPYQQNPYQQNPYQQYPYFGQQQQFPTTPFFSQGT